MPLDLKVIFLLIFFGLWAALGLLPWLVAAVVRRGRGAALALPLAVAGGCAGGVLVPLLGANDARGFLISLGAALGGALLASQLGFRLAGRAVVQAQKERDGEGVTIHHVGPGTV